MTSSPDWIVAGVATVLLVVSLRERLLLRRARRRQRELLEAAERLAISRTSLRQTRQRVRRSHRAKRRAQRVLAMARLLVGCRDAQELARRAALALVDGFGVRGAAIWTLEAVPYPLGQAGETDRVGQLPWPHGHEEAGDSPVRRLELRDEARRPVAQLFIDLGDGGEMPMGCSSYATVLGAALGASDQLNGGSEESVPAESAASEVADGTEAGEVSLTHRLPDEIESGHGGA